MSGEVGSVVSPSLVASFLRAESSAEDDSETLGGEEDVGFIFADELDDEKAK